MEGRTICMVTESADERLRWELWRQDDNGVRVLVACFELQDSALDGLARFESQHHKQTYWIEEKKFPGLQGPPSAI
jgi:hypothetical protein